MAGSHSELNQTSSIPLYRQIKQILRDEITSGRADPQTPLTEAKLMERFQVSRAPVRQALGELVDEGHVFRRQGLGTFPIVGARVERPTGVRAGGLHRFLDTEGLNPTSEVEMVEKVSAPDWLRARLNVGPRVQLLHFRRRILVEGRPLAATEMYMLCPASFFPSAEQLEIAGSAFDLLAEETGHHLRRSEHETWAAAASPEIAQRLDVADASPVLMIETIFFTESATPAGWRQAAHVPDTFRYKFTEEHS